MSERAKEIASKIIADVWPTNNCQSGFIDDVIRPVIESAVEKHMMRPHQVRDRYDNLWEQMSSGLYRMHGHGAALVCMQNTYGPLVEVQGDPLPDPSELATKARIAELEEQLDDLQQTSNAIVITNEQELSSANARIAELESEINKLKIVEVGSSEPAEIWDRDGDKWVRKSDGMYQCSLVGMDPRNLNVIVERFGPISLTPPASNPEPGSSQPGTPWDSPIKQSKPPANNPEQAKPATAKEHVMAAIDRLWNEYAAEVATKSIDLKTNYTRIIGTLMDVLDDMGSPE